MKKTKTTKSPENKASLKLQAYQYLKAKILSCEYAPSQFLNEQKLCEEMGNISRTPMRDALGRLEQEGLVTILPKRGLMVSGISAADVRSIYEVRVLVEPYALRTFGAEIPREELEQLREIIAAPNMTEDFYEVDDRLHALFVSTLPNRYLREAYDRIASQNSRFRIVTGQMGLLSQEDTCAEHLAVLDAALAGEWDKAADALSEHLIHAQQSARRVVEKFRLSE